ncbi:MAG: WD40 repeat domain-containing protein [Anaerolineae bacterium]
MQIRPLETITRLNLYDCDLSPDGQMVAAVYQEDEGPYLGLWTTSGCRPLAALRLAGPYRRPCFSPDGRLLAAAGEGEQVTVWSVPEGRVRFVQDRMGSGPIVAHAFGPSGAALAIAQGRRLTLRSLPNGDLLAAFDLPGEITCLRSSPAGRLLGVGLLQGGAVVIEWQALAVSSRLDKILQPVSALCFHPAHPWLLVATTPTFEVNNGRQRRLEHGWAELWDYRSHWQVARVACDYHAVLAGGGHYVATLTNNSRSLWFWRLGEEPELSAHIENAVPELLVDERGHEVRHVTLAATPAGDLLALGSLTRPFSAVGTLRLLAIEAEPVLAQVL